MFLTQQVLCRLRLAATNYVRCSLLNWDKLSAQSEGDGDVHSAAAKSVLRFGAFEADLQARELRKQGMQIRLQEQPFQILAFLLEHPGEIITREQLRQRLWPAGTL